MRNKAFRTRGDEGVTAATSVTVEDGEEEEADRMKEGIKLTPGALNCPCRVYMDGIICKHMIKVCQVLDVEGRDLCERRWKVENYEKMFEALGWEEGLKRRGPLPEVIDSFYNDMDECNCPEKNCECRMKYPPHIWENKKVKNANGVFEEKEICNKCGFCNNKQKKKKRGPKPSTRYSNRDRFSTDLERRK